MTAPDQPSAPRATGRVWIINQWLPPDPAPTGVLCGELLPLLREMGRPVVLMSRDRSNTQSPDEPDDTRRITIDRVAQGRTGILAKLASWPAFAWRAWRILRSELTPDDLVVVCSDPPLFYPLAIWAARGRGARVIHWSQDVYPDVVQRHWPNAAFRWLLAPVRLWRNRMLRQVDRVVVISDGMGQLMQTAGARTTLIPNWARDDRIAPRSHGDSALRREHFAAEDFVVGYSGNLGRVHEFATLVAAANILRNERRIKFLIVGSGPRKSELEAMVADARLDNFRFLPLQPESELTDTLAAGDVHFVSLQPQFEALVLPSKLYSIAAVGRPVIFCGDVNGETATLVRAHRIGDACSAGDGQMLATAIRDMAVDPVLCRQLGVNARAMIDSEYSRAAALAKWRATIESLPPQPV